MKTAALIFLILSGSLSADPEEMALVEGGTYISMFGDRTVPRSVKPFLIDKQPVTNAEFLAFVRANPKWQRSNVGKIFASETYLAHWASDLELGPNAPADAPVVNVSWFVARAYLKENGKRLPTEDEWEFAARADATRIDASKDPLFLQRILQWYAKPNPPILPSIETAASDFRGVSGMHGLVWEWVNDFNNQMVSGAARNDSSLDRSLFCAGGAANATDTSNYAAYMRYAFRSSLQGNYTVANLGFRGARDIPIETQPASP